MQRKSHLSLSQGYIYSSAKANTSSALFFISSEKSEKFLKKFKTTFVSFSLFKCLKFYGNWELHDSYELNYKLFILL